MPSSIDDEVRRLADLEAIRDLARRYADCVWRQDVAGAIDLFADDAVMDTGDRPPIRGREALLEAYGGMLGGGPLHPFVHNHVIEIDGDVATGRCYLDLRAVIDGESKLGSGFYEDAYVRTPKGWKFQSRKLDMNYLVAPGEGWVSD